MGVINSIMRYLNMIFSSKAQMDFDVKSITSGSVNTFINRCANIYQGHPEWLGDGENIKTVNFAKVICSETARLATLNVNINIEGSARAEYLQKQIDNIFSRLRNWVEYGAAYGTIVLKPNGDAVDVVLPDRFMITAQLNGKATGAVFVNQAANNNGKIFYTRLEYHRFIGAQYVITNKCYAGTTANDLTKPTAIENTPWSDLAEEVYISNLDQPLFAVLKMPGANTIDANSPMGLPLFAAAFEELRDLDIAYSRNAEEIFDSERVVLLDADKLIPRKGTTSSPGVQKAARQQMELPKYVRNVVGNGVNDFYQEINPTLNTTMRMEGINALLSQIGFKCGFSNGYFVFNEKTGMVTATQVESDDRRTLQTITDVRTQLKTAITDLIYALAKFADLYDLSPAGEYQVIFDFEDLTENLEEDKIRWLQYVDKGLVPKWQYLVRFEGMSEEEAKAMVTEATAEQAPQAGLFLE